MIRLLIIYVILDKCIELMFSVISTNLSMNKPNKLSPKPLFNDSMRTLVKKVNLNISEPDKRFIEKIIHYNDKSPMK
jgi:hypothetical protein